MNNTHIKNVIDVFRKGGIVVFPTDTAYGIGCRMDFVTSVRRVFEIRHRVESKPLLVLASDLEMVERYAHIDDKVAKYVEANWPGGVTLILPCKEENVPGVVRANGSTLAMRIPKHNELLAIIEDVGVPIVAPSANISGEKTPYSIEEVDSNILGQVDYVFFGDCTYKKESTIIDTTTTPWKVIREGAIKVQSL